MTSVSAAATEAAFDIRSVKELLDGIDPAALLPDIGSIVGIVQLVCMLAVLVGPVLLVATGLAYLLFSPKEANHYFGYCTTFGMGSVPAWRNTQKVAGLVFSVLGAVLLLVMLLVAASFSGSEAMDMVWRAFRCLLWEGGLTLAAIFAINTVAALRFDYHGKRRKK